MHVSTFFCLAITIQKYQHTMYSEGERVTPFSGLMTNKHNLLEVRLGYLYYWNPPLWNHFSKCLSIKFLALWKCSLNFRHKRTYPKHASAEHHAHESYAHPHLQCNHYRKSINRTICIYSKQYLLIYYPNSTTRALSRWDD